MIVLEPLDRALERGATVYCEMRGARRRLRRLPHHLARARRAPAPSGRSRRRSRSAGIEACGIDCIVAHGTGTSSTTPPRPPRILRVLRDASRRARHGAEVRRSGTHSAPPAPSASCVGALAVRTGSIPPTHELRDARPGLPARHRRRRAARGPVGARSSNAFGFGGQNAVVVLRRPDADAGSPVLASCTSTGSVRRRGARQPAPRACRPTTPRRPLLPVLERIRRMATLPCWVPARRRRRRAEPAVRLIVDEQHRRRRGLESAGRAGSAMARTIRNLERFHRRQLIEEFGSEVEPGVASASASCPSPRPACYVPFGKAVYPSSALMLTMPARVAGVERIVLASGVDPSTGEIPAAVAAAASMGGATDDLAPVGHRRRRRLGVRHGDAARRSDVMAGPGGPYVAAAKRLVQDRVGVDLDAGPSETLVLALDDADPRLVATDVLISEAEHGDTTRTPTPSDDRPGAGRGRGGSRWAARRPLPAERRDAVADAARPEGAARSCGARRSPGRDPLRGRARGGARRGARGRRRAPWRAATLRRHGLHRALDAVARGLLRGRHQPRAPDGRRGAPRERPRRRAPSCGASLRAHHEEGLRALRPTLVAYAAHEGLPAHRMAVEQRFRRTWPPPTAPARPPAAGIMQRPVQKMTIYGVSFDWSGSSRSSCSRPPTATASCPIWIGHPEAAAILQRLQGKDTPRPMTHDLFVDMLGELEAEIVQIAVTELRDNTFYARITLRRDGTTLRDRLAPQRRDRARRALRRPDLRRGRRDRGERDRDGGRGRRAGRAADPETEIEGFREFLENVRPEDFGGRSRRLSARPRRRRASPSVSRQEGRQTSGRPRRPSGLVCSLQRRTIQSSRDGSDRP